MSACLMVASSTRSARVDRTPRASRRTCWSGSSTNPTTCSSSPSPRPRSASSRRARRRCSGSRALSDASAGSGSGSASGAAASDSIGTISASELATPSTVWAASTASVDSTASTASTASTGSAASARTGSTGSGLSGSSGWGASTASSSAATGWSEGSGAAAAGCSDGSGAAASGSRTSAGGSPISAASCSSSSSAGGSWSDGGSSEGSDAAGASSSSSSAIWARRSASAFKLRYRSSSYASTRLPFGGQPPASEPPALPEEASWPSDPSSPFWPRRPPIRPCLRSIYLPPPAVRFPLVDRGARLRSPALPESFGTGPDPLPTAAGMPVTTGGSPMRFCVGGLGVLRVHRERRGTDPRRYRSHSGLRAAAHAEPPEDRGEARLDGLLGQEQGPGAVPVALSLGQQGQDVGLSLRQAGRGAAVRLVLVAASYLHGVEQVLDDPG